MPANLTEIESAALSASANLSDGHAYRSPSKREAAVLETAGRLLLGLDRRNLEKLSRVYLEEFFALGKQTLRVDDFHAYHCLSASMAIEMIANHLRLQEMRAVLVEPCFDNLSDILKRHQVSLGVIPDDLYEHPSALVDVLDRHETDAVFLVSPNNPTGRHLPAPSLKAVAEHCARRGRLLILDACFRFYMPERYTYDQYAILMRSGADWILIEDTGKTWPTQEVKAPFFCTSASVTKPLGRIYNDFLLMGSPFALALLTELVRSAAEDGLESVQGIVEHNRSVLRRALAGTTLRPVEMPFVGVSWLALQEGTSADEFCAVLSGLGVEVLPGGPFFWNDSARGAHYMRVSLVRDPDVFQRAVTSLACAWAEFGGSSA
ncbi:aminotransferase class I/II-fold pyridoxal phosphate-dependent enzyme [Streptomyces sp. NPDC048508]|uniref:aminotransferase class I/II-fold pyridoxal phosphate-dependent enzyme n=1 Tax=Streptomyces sp. NPDC048508 TaxID=3365561 RepID=UPI00371BB358